MEDGLAGDSQRGWPVRWEENKERYKKPGEESDGEGGSP